MLLEVFLTLVGILVSLVFIRWKLSYGLFQKHDIRGPPPTLYFGNTSQIIKMGYLNFIESNLKLYGQVFGYFIGIEPFMVVKDLDLLKEIMVKKFDNFINKGIRKLDVINFNPESILRAEGNDWKRQRKILSKSFSTAKLNKMSPIIENSCDSLVRKIEEIAKEGQSVDIFKLYGLYTLEVILVGGFGHKIDVINGQGDKLSAKLGDTFKYIRDSNLLIITTLISNFPILKHAFKVVIDRSARVKDIKYIIEKSKEIIQDRVQDSSAMQHQDLLQLLIDAKADSDDEDNEGAGQQAAKTLFIDEIESAILKAFLVLFWTPDVEGYETTSNTLACTSYLLALHPEEQQKIFNEIDKYFHDNPDASLLEASHSLKYVDMAIQESLRMYPPSPLVNRTTTHDIKIKDQFIPSGCGIIIPIQAIHHSPDIWPEPTKFRPERFTREEKEKRHPLAHMPFGYGPRSCIAMRLALMETKMALIAIMKEYKFVEGPDTEKEPLQMSHGTNSTMAPLNGIHLRLENRVQY